jgi:CubicO group peptidase (beta-lactamase class C family)
LDERELASLLNETLQTVNIPGASLAVLKDGEILVASAGLADIEAGRPISPETQFPIASVTKPMVATAIAILDSEGKLTLDDPIARHAPEIRSAGWSEQVTVAHLLANRSGVPLQVAWEFGFDDEEKRALARFCEVVARHPLQTPAGERWSYCNTGWSLLGRAIETITGLSWPDAMRVLVFEPLEMKAIGLQRNASNFVAGHQLVEGKQSVATAWKSPGLGPGGGLLWSTAFDLAQFARAHVKKDGAFSIHDFTNLLEPQVSPAIWPWMDQWCRGWAYLSWSGGPVWGWDGVTTGGRAQLRVVPSKSGAIALLTNSGNGRGLYWSLMPILMKSLFGVTMPSRPGRVRAELDLSAFEGKYSWPDREIVVAAKTDRLAISIGESTVDAFPSLNTTFLLEVPSPDPLTVTFDYFDTEGRAQMLYWVVWGYPRRAVRQS